MVSLCFRLSMLLLSGCSAAIASAQGASLTPENDFRIADIAPPAAKPEVDYHPFLGVFPIFGKAAAERGVRLPRPLGLSGMTIHNDQQLDGRDLAVAFGKGSTIPDAGSVFEVPFVKPRLLASHTYNSEFKVDLWIFPFLDAFIGIGKAKGHMDVLVDIDLDQALPFPICRPAKPCGVLRLPFVADVDNTTVTPGVILAYGGKNWFVSASLAKTLSVSAKDRSDIETTDIGFRVGPRLAVNPRFRISPYVGADYFRLDTRVNGVVSAPGVFEDGEALNLRYSLDLSSRRPWATIVGAGIEFGTHWMAQAEYNFGKDSDRFVLSLTVRP